MAQQFKPAQREQNIIDDRSNRLQGFPLEGSDKKPTLSVAWFNGRARLNVYTNRDGDPDDGRINAAFYDDNSFEVMLDLIIEATTQKNPWKRSIDVASYRKGVTTGPVTDVKVTIGRDADGYVFIGMTKAGGGPSVKFNFHPHVQHPLFDEQNNQLSPQEASDRYARAWSNRIRRLISVISPGAWTPPPPLQSRGNNNGGKQWGNNNNGGNRGGGNNNWNGGGQQQQNNNNGFDDDIPF